MYSDPKFCLSPVFLILLHWDLQQILHLESILKPENFWKQKRNSKQISVYISPLLISQGSMYTNSEKYLYILRFINCGPNA